MLRMTLESTRAALAAKDAEIAALRNELFHLRAGWPEGAQMYEEIAALKKDLDEEQEARR
jgi:hypothetical protein